MVRYFLSVLALLVFLGLSVDNLEAQELKVAVVDIQRALDNSDMLKKARNVFQKKFAPDKKKVRKMEIDLRQLKADLEKRKNLLTGEAVAELSEEYQRKLRSYQRFRQDAQAVVDRENRRLTIKNNEIMKQVLDELVKENGFSLILAKGQYLFASSSIDITDLVIARLNARTKSK